MIVEPAIKIGLDHFTIVRLAERLGTGISAIYRVMRGVSAVRGDILTY